MHYKDNQILEKKNIGENIKSFRIYSPAIAGAALPGQFVILRLHERGERFPLTLCNWDKDKGWIQLVVQEVGKSTRELGMMGEGEVIMDILGPLGKPAEIEKWGRVICVAGGVGTAEMYPVARAMQEAGNEVTGIIGFRSEKQVILKEELEEVMKELFITTEDGSVGIKGLVTDVLQKLLKEGTISLVYSVGPLIMMKVVSEMTREFAVPTVVSLNPIMVDGTGMCGGCRVKVGDEIKFACVDGPEFDGHKVDFTELMVRNKRFQEEEKCALERFLKGGKDGQ